MNILIVSPSFIPDANVGKMRMSSLARWLNENNSVTVIQNTVESYKSITQEEPIEGVNIRYVNVTSSFIQNSRLYKEAMKACVEAEAYDVMIISVGPYFTLPLVAYAKKISAMRVIIDYRDLWTKTYRTNEREDYLKQFIKKAFFERPALRKVDALMVCAEGEIDVLTQQYPFLNAKPKKCIFNGYDDKSLGGFEAYSRVDKKGCTIGIYGKFESYIGLNNLDWFIAVLKKIALKKASNIRIIHYGAEELVFWKKLEEAKIEYQWRGFVKYEQGIKGLAEEADILAAANDVMIGYGTKLFDYIFLNKPVIMYAVKHSDLDRVVNRFRYGFTFSDAKELEWALDVIYDDKANVLDMDIDPLQYSRSKQNKEAEKFVKYVVEK